MYTLGWVQLPEPQRGGGVGGDTPTHIFSTVARFSVSGPHNSTGVHMTGLQPIFLYIAKFILTVSVFICNKIYTYKLVYICLHRRTHFIP
jgi:hypothetical protein